MKAIFGRIVSAAVLVLCSVSIFPGPSMQGQARAGNSGQAEAAGSANSQGKSVDQWRLSQSTSATRITARVPNRPVPLAQPFEVSVTISGKFKGQVLVAQSKNNDSAAENKKDGEDVGAKIVPYDGTTQTIEITPLLLGTVNITIVAVSEDGKTGHKVYPVEVVPNAKGLKHFYLNDGLSVVPITLGEKNGIRSLSAELDYDQLDNSIDLFDLTHIQFTVEQSKTNPVIRLAPNGDVQGLRPGKAIITGNFDGVKDSVTVEVFPKGGDTDHMPNIGGTPYAGSMGGMGNGGAMGNGR